MVHWAAAASHLGDAEQCRRLYALLEPYGDRAVPYILLRMTIQAEAPAESPDETAAQYEWAIRKNPDDRVLRYNYGLFLFDHNYDAAVAQLRMSRPWDGFPVFAPDGTLVE